MAKGSKKKADWKLVGAFTYCFIGGSLVNLSSNGFPIWGSVNVEKVESEVWQNVK